MSDKPYGYTHCKCCGDALHKFSDQADGLHSKNETDPSCFLRWVQWHEKTKLKSAFALSYNSPERAVAIDEWLVAGAP